MPPDISGPADESLLVTALTRVIERRLAHSLIVSDGISERIFYFAIGGIRVIRSGPRKTSSVADILVDSGKLTAEDLGRVIAASKQDGQLFGDSVCALGLLQPADLDEALRAKVKDELLDLFLWEGAEIRLQDGQPPKSFYEGRFEAARITCDVSDFLRTVLARVEEWRAILGRLPTSREVYEASESARVQFTDEGQARLLAQIDGTRTAGDAITQSGMRRVPAYEFLLELLRDSRVRRVAGSSAQKVTRDELVKEIEALQDALHIAVDATIVRARLARAYEAIGENSRAAAEWRALGDGSRRENELDRALEQYRCAVRVVPTDFATRELILEIHRHKRDYGQLVADGRPLADLFFKHNLLNRAKNLLIQLVGMEAQDSALRRQLIMVLIGLGEREAALKQLRDLARLLEQRKASVSELRDVYVRILALDPKDKHAQDRLDTITGTKFQRRMLRITVVATAAAMVVIGVWFTYETAARRELNSAIESARQDITRADFASAKEKLKKAMDGYTYARSGGAAWNLIEQIERFELRERERMSSGAELTKTSAERDEEAAQSLVDRARELAADGKNDDAYRTYRELFEVFGDVPLVESVSLPLQLTVLPADAHVRLAGQEIGQGSMVLKYSPHAKRTLLVEREGYVSFKMVLDGPQEASLDAALEKPTKWTFTADAALDAQPLVVGRMLYVAGRDRCLTAMSAQDGAVQWRTPLGFYSDVSVRPVMTADGVFVATATGDAVCLNPTTGEVRWRKELGAPVDLQPLAAKADVLLVCANDGSLRALDATSGEVRWALPPNSALAVPAAVDDGQIAFVDPKGVLVFASLATGAVVPGHVQAAVLRGAPVNDDKRLWVRGEGGSLWIISLESRRAVKSCPVPAGSEFPPAVSSEAVFALSVDGGVYAYRSSGDPLFHVKLDEPPSAPPTYSKGRLYVPGQKGHVHVLDAATGEILWRFDAKARVTAAPVIDNGTIYVVTAAGTLIAVQE